MAARIAIEIDRRRVRALLATCDRGRVRIERVLVADVPDDIAADDPAALGTWVGAQLAAAAFPKARATLALARKHVVVKRLHLPTTDDDELPDMTRLAFQRDLPFDPEQAVIDYAPVRRDETGTTVLAVAVPEAAVANARAGAAAAGLTVERIALRATGAAALVRGGSAFPDAAGGVLIVDVTMGAIEFCVDDDEAIRFSRAATMSDDADAEETILTETRRSWMSYRIVEGAADVERAVLLGDRALTERVAGPIAGMLGAPAVPFEGHPLIEIGPDAAGPDIDLVWPLAGLLLESELGAETIDFSSARRPRDRGALARRRGLIVLGAVIVAAMATWTFGSRSLNGLDSTLAALRTREAALAPRGAAYLRDTWTLAHLKRWESVQADWLSHLGFVHGLLPTNGTVVLDGWTGTLDFRGVRYDRKAETWSTPHVIAIVLDGEATDRATADGLRDALVRAKWYVTSSSGADAATGRRLPCAFTYRLKTEQGAVPSDAAPADADPEVRPADDTESAP